LSEDDILNGFVELREYIGHCKFSNVSHLKEPNVAIQQALADNKISQQRMNKYNKNVSEYVE